MFPFCPHCGQFLSQAQAPGQLVVCRHCGRQIGAVPAAAPPKVIDQAEELIRSGAAARCPQCLQLVEVRTHGATRALARHFAQSPPSKLCPGSGQALAAPAPAPPPVSPPPPPPTRTPPGQPTTPPVPAKATVGGKDLSAYVARDRVHVVSCQQ